MRQTLLIFMVIAGACVGSLQAASVSYVGSLAYAGTGGSGDNELFVTGSDWICGRTTLSWKVDNTTTPGMWHYEYTLIVPNKAAVRSDIFSVIIEASNGSSGPMFTRPDLVSPASSPSDWLQSLNVGEHFPADNPNLPKILYGIEFSTRIVDPTTLTISFDTSRQPVWGDLYARSFTVNGDFNAFYNTGLEFIGPDTDPSDPASNGSIDNHVLVPDSVPTPSVPAPAAVLLGAMGASLTGLLRRRRWL